MVYEAWPARLRYSIQNYPGDGYVCTFTVKWMPGMAGDFRDIRFSDGLGVSLPYWIETKTDSTVATIRVRLARSATVYLHYGNGAAVSESDGDAVFDFFDDFTGTALNAVKWYGETAGTTTLTVANSELALTSAIGNGNQQVIRTNKMFPLNRVLEYRVKQGAARYYNEIGFATSSSGVPLNGYSCRYYMAGGYSQVSRLKTYTNVANSQAIAVSEDGNTYYNMKLDMCAANQRIYRNGELIASRTDTLNNNSSYRLCIMEYSPFNATYSVTVDKVMVRKYVAVEPTAVLVSSGSLVPFTVSAGMFGNSYVYTRDVDVTVHPAHAKLDRVSYYQQARYIGTFKTDDPAAYADWQEWIRYRIQNYPGDGYVCTFTVAWKPGMRGDFRDIRFSDGLETKLPYWIESYTAFGTAKAHVRLARSSTVFLCYGNGAAISESNGDATFELFDHFDGVALNSNKWDVYPVGMAGNYSVSNSELAVWTRTNNSGDAPYYGVIRSKIAFGTGYELVTRTMQDSTGDYTFIGFYDAWRIPTTGYNAAAIVMNYDNTIRAFLRNNPNQTSSDPVQSFSASVFYKMQLKRLADGSCTVIIDGMNSVTLSTNKWAGVGYVNIENWAGNPIGAAVVDWIYVKKSVPIEPTPVQASASSRTLHRYRSGWKEYNRESGQSVSIPWVLTDRDLALTRAPSMCTYISEEVDRVLVLPRSASAFIPIVSDVVDRALVFTRAPSVFIPPVRETIDRALASLRTSAVNTVVAENVGRVLGSGRNSGVYVPRAYDKTDRVLAMPRDPSMYIPTVRYGADIIQRVCFRSADFAVHNIQTDALADIVYAWPNYPFDVTYEIDGETVTGPHQIALGDSVRIVGWLHDTDPFSAVDRMMSFVGYRVKLVMLGGSPTTLIVKDCNVSSGGRVECKLISADITVHGEYICKFVVLGVHSSVTGYRKELPERRRDWFMLHVNAGG